MVSSADFLPWTWQTLQPPPPCFDTLKSCMQRRPAVQNLRTFESTGTKEDRALETAITFMSQSMSLRIAFLLIVTGLLARSQGRIRSSPWLRFQLLTVRISAIAMQMWDLDTVIIAGISSIKSATLLSQKRQSWILHELGRTGLLPWFLSDSNDVLWTLWYVFCLFRCLSQSNEPITPQILLRTCCRLMFCRMPKLLPTSSRVWILQRHTVFVWEYLDRFCVLIMIS